MTRPSHIVLPFALLTVAALVATGHLPLDRETVPSAPAKPEPVVVKAPQPPSGREQRARLRGRLLGPRGFVVAGAEVALGSGVTARTDGDGTFDLEVKEPAPWSLRIAAPGFRKQQRTLFGEAADPLWIRLEPEAPWDALAAAGADPAAEAAAAPPPLIGEGFVRSPAGEPLAGALVQVAGSSIRTRTDEIGRYRIPVTTAAELIVSADRGADQPGLCVRSEPLQFERTTGVVPLPDLVPVPGATLRGTVRDAGGRPLAGVPLRLTGEGGERVVESGRDGVFRIGGVLAGSYELLAMAWRGAVGCAQQVLVDTAVVDCDLQLRGEQERRVRVVREDGAPVAEAWIAASLAGTRREVVRTDPEGFALLGTPADVATIEIRNKELAALEWKHSDDGACFVVAMP